MFNFKYEIKTNEEGRPYVAPCMDQTEHPEHKFMALEITRYLLNGLLEDNKTTKELEPESELEIARAGHLLEQISDRVGEMIIEQNNALDDLGLDIKDE